VTERDRQRRDWDDLAAFDPWSAILREPRRRERWQLDEFLATGERDTERALGLASSHGLPRRHSRALDFGCGVGRVSIALASRFDEVLGMDISPTMVERARAVGASIPNCRFMVGAEPELRALPLQHFDFVVALLVLQHLRSSSEVDRHVRELTRVVAPGGALVLQVPSRLSPRRRIQSRRRAYVLLRRLGVPPDFLLGRLGLDPIRTVALSESRVKTAVMHAGGIIAAAEDDDATGPHVSSRRYLITRSH
jgi:SAM-dependent methyltransferase